MNRGPSQLRREQATFQRPEEAAARVRMALGDMAPILRREAEWRRKEPSQSQQKAWSSLHRNDPQNPEEMTAGEIWDSISKERFRRRVNPASL